jgi:hypothetical protein
LSDCIAEASQDNRRNPQYPEIPQPSYCAHIFSFVVGKVVVPRRVAIHTARLLGAVEIVGPIVGLIVKVQFRAACGVPWVLHRFST